MNKVLNTLAAATVFAVSTGAHAETWRFDNLSIRGLSDTVKISLVSQSATETTISFDSFALETGTYAANDNAAYIPDNVYYPGGIDKRGMTVFTAFRFNLAPGSVLTGATINGTINGELRTGQPGGHTENAIALQGEFGEIKNDGAWGYHFFRTQRVADLDGTAAVSASLGLSLAGGGDIDAHDGMYFMLMSDQSSFASAARRYDTTLIEASYANIWAPKVTMTFHISAVPEPTTYAMLGAGLALLGAAALRKRSQRG